MRRSKSTEMANNFMDKRSKMSMKEFSELNVNEYINYLPKHVEFKHNSINNWIENNTKRTYWYGIVSESIPSYPFSKI